MPDDPRVKQTKSLIKDTRKALKDLPPDQVEAAPPDAQQQVPRFGEILTYSEQVLEGSDPLLVPKGAWDQVDSILTAVREAAPADPVGLVTNQLEAHASSLLTQLSQFPSAQGKGEADAIARVAAALEAEGEERLKGLSQQLAEAEKRGSEIRTEIDKRSAELTAAIEARKQELDQAISEVQTALADERQRIEQTTTEQAETFRQGQEERAEQFSTSQEEHQGRVKEIESKANERAEALVKQMEDMRDKSAQLVGAIGITGTAERYQAEAKEQKQAADNWRWITVVGVVVAAGFALFAAHGGTGDPGTFIGRLAIGAAIGAFAAYTAKQSSRHRDREEDAKATQLDLAAFQVFIEDVPDDQQAKERVALGRRLFGQRFAAARRKGDDQGPTLANQIADSVAARIKEGGTSGD